MLPEVLHTGHVLVGKPGCIIPVARARQCLLVGSEPRYPQPYFSEPECCYINQCPKPDYYNDYLASSLCMPKFADPFWYVSGMFLVSGPRVSGFDLPRYAPYKMSYVSASSKMNLWVLQ